MNKKRPFRILQLVANDTAEFFPYFFIFYIVSFVASIFNESWHSFFYWTAFHIFAVCFALIALFSENVSGQIGKNIQKGERVSSSALSFLEIFFGKNIKKGKKASRFTLSFLEIFYSFLAHLILGVFYRIGRLAKRSYLFTIKKLTKKNIFKIIIIATVLAFVFYKNTGVLDSITIFYALVAIFFPIDSRISAGAALILLAVCPIALVLKKGGVAETCAIYAFYFLIITVVSQIKEQFSLKPVEK